MWIYAQRTGNLTAPDGKMLAIPGYSGHGSGKNAPDMQRVPNIGPCCRGWYTITEPFNSPLHGSFAMRLVPNAANEMYGRGGFMIHGDSLSKPGTASQGCIILSRPVREKIWASGDHRLLVVA